MIRAASRRARDRRWGYARPREWSRYVRSHRSRVPPTSGVAMLARPCANSSAFGLCRSPSWNPPPRPTKAFHRSEQRDRECGGQQRQDQVGAEYRQNERRQAGRNRAEPRADGVHRKVEDGHERGRDDESDDRPRHARKEPRNEAPSREPIPTPSTHGSIPSDGKRASSSQRHPASHPGSPELRQRDEKRNAGEASHGRDEVSRRCDRDQHRMTPPSSSPSATVGPCGARCRRR